MVSLNVLGTIWIILVALSFSKKMSSTIMLTVISIVFQNSLFISIMGMRISIFEISALLLILRYFCVNKQRLYKTKSLICYSIVCLSFLLISLIDVTVFKGYEIKLYAEYLGLYQIGIEKVTLNISLFIAIVRFALYGVVYEIISNYVKTCDVKDNDKNAINTLRISVYLVCIIGIIQVLTCRGILNFDAVMRLVHDKNMGAASAYYANYIRLFSTFAEPSYCAPWLVAAMWSLIVCNEYIRRIEKYILITLLAVEIVLSNSYTGYIAFALMLIYYGWSKLKNKKNVSVIVILIVITGAICLITPLGQNILGSVVRKINSTSGLSRLAYVKDCYRVFWETKGMGVGYMKIKCMTLISGLMAQVGIIGTVAFCWMIINFLKRECITNTGKVTKTFFISVLISSEISCSGLVYLAPLWYGFCLYAITNYNKEKVELNKYNEIVFNGKYMCKKEARGVHRYVKEVLHALDKLPEAKKVKVIIPHKINYMDKFNNIQIIKYGGFFTYKLWQYLGFQLYILSHRSLAINLADAEPFFDVGICAIHDVRYIEDLKMKMPLKNKARLLLSEKICSRSIYKSKEIITVSEFSKKEILKNYEINPEKITVCYNAWQHLSVIGFNDEIFNINPKIIKRQYYFMLGGNEESKNMYWILNMVKKYPERMFVMAGPKNLFFPSENISLSEYNNFIHVGYVSDEELKSLMKFCKAFLFPSKYEGFGIPPMEAISVGAKVLMSNSTCLPEIYKNYVVYFDPDDYEVDLDELLENYPCNSSEILGFYSWDKTAKQILDLSKKYVRI